MGSMPGRHFPDTTPPRRSSFWTARLDAALFFNRPNLITHCN
jgi:hypothetical protein